MRVLGEMTSDTGRLGNRIWACFAPLAIKAEGAVPEAGVETVTYSHEELLAAVRAGQFQHALHVAILAVAAASAGVLTIS